MSISQLVYNLGGNRDVNNWPAKSLQSNVKVIQSNMGGVKSTSFKDYKISKSENIMYSMVTIFFYKAIQNLTLKTALKLTQGLFQ